MPSSVSSSIAPLQPIFPRPASATSPPPEPPALASLISHLKLQPHIEGGYFAETDRDTLRIPNPFLAASAPATATTSKSIAALRGDPDFDPEQENATRSASTSIFYLLTPGTPLGAWHRNRGRTVHTLHWGKGRYVIIHADEVGEDGKARVETFVVGKDVLKGERLQWIVEGGKFKSSFLLPDDEGEASGGLLISETVIPGFEYSDHDFLRGEKLKELVTPEQAKELGWMLRNEPPPEEHELVYKQQ
ncbi:hypothetical protein BU16DRAFT_618731 [Lophium mytilinum]|uniref:DUF985 domain-containing protein n=1 Tax=Lophium mytilinum TaxID=390894 RepID=A0A6A6QQG6_9PEZI|nr:hypothetical protein BU16DRAFT_618731 [Lophium mytilinum]